MVTKAVLTVVIIQEILPAECRLPEDNPCKSQLIRQFFSYLHFWCITVELLSIDKKYLKIAPKLTWN